MDVKGIEEVVKAMVRCPEQDRRLYRDGIRAMPDRFDNLVRSVVRGAKSTADLARSKGDLIEEKKWMEVRRQASLPEFRAWLRSWLEMDRWGPIADAVELMEGGPPLELYFALAQGDLDQLLNQVRASLVESLADIPLDSDGHQLGLRCQQQIELPLFREYLEEMLALKGG